MKKIGLLPKLVIGIVLGITIGLISNELNNYFIARIFVTFSSIFGNFISFIVPCIILGFVAPSIADLGSKSGKLLALTAGFAYISSVVAGSVAFLLGSVILPNVIKPGKAATEAAMTIDAYFNIEMPQIMGVMSALVLAFILGLGMAYIKENKLLGVFKDFQNIISLTIKKVLIPFMPLYISGIFVKLTLAGQIFKTLKAFGSVYILLLLLQVGYILMQYTIAYALTGKKPIKSIKNMIPAYFTALGTQSSAATIPVTLECVRKNEVSEDIIDFVIPLGATIHLAGDTITLVLASMGVMLLAGQTPTFILMFPFILMLGVTMVAAPGIPGGGVIAALGILESMLGFGVSQKGLMVALHAAQDSFGTATNVTGDGAIAMIVDKISKTSRKK